MAEPATISIAGHIVGPGAPTFIIAEIGINHGGDEDVCASMIEAAAGAGADAAKLQTVVAEESYRPDTDSYREFSGTALTREALARLMGLAAQRGIILFSSPGDFPSLDLMTDIGMKAVKISSGLMTNLPLVRRAAATGLPLIVSTGMAGLDEVIEAVTAAREAGCADLAVLHCTSLYPAPAESLNLRAIRTLAEATEAPAGYSDHHEGSAACLAAVAAGASLIEKHFTLDRSAPGADHALSMEPDDLAALVRDIRAVEAMLGNSEKAPVAEEIPLRDGRHRYLVARRDIAEGAVIGPDDVALMRVPAGAGRLDARRYDEVIGATAARAVARLDCLAPEDMGLE